MARPAHGGGDILIDTDKKNFQTMMNIVMSNYGRKNLDPDSLRYWFGKLDKYELETVSQAFDAWIDSKSELPTAHDILQLCKPKVTIHARLPSPLNIADNKRHADELKSAIGKMTKPRKNYRAWAERIIANPSAYPDISLNFAHQAMAARAE